MIRQNVGRLDRTLRLVAGVVIIPTGLSLLNGWQGDPIGIVVAALGLVPLVTGLTGFCPGYVPFGVATVARERNRVRTT